MALRGHVNIWFAVVWVANSATSGQQCENSTQPFGQDHVMIQAGHAVRHKLSKMQAEGSPLTEMIGSVLQELLNDESVMNLIPAEYQALLADPRELMRDPMALLNNPALAPVREKVLTAIKKPLEQAVDKIGPLKKAMETTGKNTSEMVDLMLSCSSQKACGDCTNEMAPCYWCAASGSCHPVGSQQLHIAMSDASDCTTSTCQSQWPSSSCKSAYCADGSSVGNDNGPCGGRMNCEACTKGKCFWCGISGSCHSIGSRFFDRRCTAGNCQAKKWYSSCKSKQCSDATRYQAPR